MQARRLDTHALLGQPHTREWVEAVLAFLKAFVEEGMYIDMEPLGKSNMQAYVASLIEDVRQDVSELNEGTLAVTHPCVFYINV